MPAKLESSVPAPTDRERVWAAIRELRNFTSFDIALKTRLPRRGGVIPEYLKGLERAGFLRVVSGGREGDPPVADAGGTEGAALRPERKRGAPNHYELARDVGVEAPRVNKQGGILAPSGRTRMWKAMRILGSFTARELALVASLPDSPVAVAEAEYYCNWLCKGGYLRGSESKDFGGRRWTFIPAMNSGPKAPQILRVKKLYDPNRNAVVCEGEAKGRDDE